ncbi:MAG: acyl-CoA/acyl-ACP dehydrogenase [Armatimonadetes bacterium]|nr:acyl-CoA/acyl-ACP dehydrogenase [Armatimonadota bacterium]
MDLSFTEEQEMLRTMARDFLTDKFPKTTVKELEESETGYTPEVWQEIAELGWMGLVFPEEYGGAGMTFLDLAVLLEEMGRAAMPGPYLSTVILGGLPILEAGTEAQKQQYLPAIASGEAIFTAALTEASAGYTAADIQLAATADGDGYVLNGTKPFGPDAHVADYMLCAARTSNGSSPEDGITIFIVDAKSQGITINPLVTMAKDKLCEVVFSGVKVAKENILGEPDKGWDEVSLIIQRAAVAKCLETVGGLQQALDMTIDYAKERKQFGRPIGSFQIIQHYCTYMDTDIDGLRLATYQAAWKLNENLPATTEVAVAKAWASQAIDRVITLSHQIHGAIGVTIDHDLHYYTRRAKAASLSFGGASLYQEIVAQQMGL